MKIIHFSIITICLIGFLFMPSYLKSIQADNTSGIEIQNIQVKPSIIKVGDTFTVTATLLNNSTVPIVLDSSTCSIEDTQVPFFTIMFDNHAKIKAKNMMMTCAGVGLSQILNPGKNIIGTSPEYTLVYIATESGTANGTVTFSYHVPNQTDSAQPNIEQNISKSFLFTILNNNTGIRTITETVLSPLKQYETGLEVKDVTCKSDFQLMIKLEDGFPACVRPQTVQKLVERSWGISWVIAITKNTSENSTRSNPVIDLISISGTGSPPNPGGPEIQITLKNIGMKPVTNLFATLVLNNNYTFNFKYVTESNPLAPGHLTSETQILIGAGYTTGISYPLIVTGTVNNEPFSYTLNVPIPYSNENEITKYQKENSTSALKLFMSADSDTIKPENPIGITISVNNTFATPVDIPAQNNWQYPNVSTGPCDTIGYGVSILDGFYDENNLTQGKILNLFNPDTNCPIIQETAKVYEFQPNSGNVKQIQCKPIEGLQCEMEPYQMGQNYMFNGYWDSGIVQPFKSGIYTVVGADEWGHVAIEHFVVTNSTIFAGDLGTTHCPMMFSGIQFGATIKNSTGFANYYNSTQDGHMFFFLHPGMQGTINVQYTSPANAAWFQNNGNTPFNITNGATLSYMANVTNSKMIISYAVSLYNDETGHHSQICHYGIPYGGFAEPCNFDNKGDIPPSELPDASKLLHPGINTSFEPNSVMLYPNSNPVFTATISANSDAMPGTYWLSLERSLCGPGVLAKLVVLP